MRNILGSAIVAGVLLLAVAAEAQPADISLPDVLAVELPKGVTQIGPNDSPLRELLASARSGGRKVISDLQGDVGVGPVKVTFSALDASGRPAATRTVRIFVLLNGMTPVGVSADENATTGNNAAHIARDAAGYVHMVWQDGGRSGARTGPVYRRAAVAPDGAVYLQTDPIYIADSGPSDWNAYPGLAVSGHSVELVWQGGGMAYVRRVYQGPNGWTMGPVINTGVKSGGRDVGAAIAFDAKGGLHLVTPDGLYAFSGDSGRTWKSDTIPLPPGATLKTESVAVDPAGTVHVAFTAPMTRPNPPAGKQGGYWQLRTIARTPDGSWRDAEDVLAGAPGWKELQGPDDMLADWTRIAADNQGGLHVTWHGTTLSHAFSHDSAFYAWKKPGGTWSAPVSLMPPDPSRGIKYSFAPSLSLDGDHALAMVFYDVYNGADWVGFDSSLVSLRGGVMNGPAMPASQLVHDAIAAGRPKSAIGPRFPGVAPTPWHAANGQTWLDVVETMQSPFEPGGPHLIVYQRLDIGSVLRR